MWLLFLILAAVSPAWAAPKAPKAPQDPPPCTASWYGENFRGRPTASGERFNPGDLTAAHLKLPFGTRVKVTYLATGRSVVVRINDRGPHVAGRCIDLSQHAAKRVGLAGVGKVQLQVLGAKGRPKR